MTSKIRITASKEHDFTPGLTRTAGGFHMTAVSGAEALSLALYRGEEKAGELAFPEGSRLGNIREADLSGDFSGLSYTLLEDGKERSDPFGREYAGGETFGDPGSIGLIRKARFPEAVFDWENDAHPETAFSDTVIYRLHVRGFTAAGAPGVPAKARGTFLGLEYRIPYLRELGVTAVELLPVCEFGEVMTLENGIPGSPAVPSGKINYWGYGAEYAYFAPKASYAAGKSPSEEFRHLVRELHRAGIEIYLDFWFAEKENPLLIREVARFWVTEYHADGLRFSGPADVGYLASDPVLARTKLFANHWEIPETAGRRRENCFPDGFRNDFPADYHDGFRNDMRHVLRGDEGWLARLIYRSRHIPETRGIVNYLANTNGFTLADLVSYEKRHNEANGEENRDGENDNISDNCGAEGPSKKKSVREFRKRRIRMALRLLLLSQGTPLILSGDEFGNSQGGNNNAWCQDNEVSWLNWKDLKKNRWIFEEVKELIEFRKSHSAFRREKAPRNTDFLSLGFPDVSYHGSRAWKLEPENTGCHLGIYYYGPYGTLKDGTQDRSFYAAYNFSGEEQEFALPTLTAGYAWRPALPADPDYPPVFRDSGKSVVTGPGTVELFEASPV